MKKKNSFPINYKIVYESRDITRERYITTFTAQEAVEQLKLILSSEQYTITNVYEWDQYVGGGSWIEDTEYII
jgi:hypothetical protein